MIRFHPLASVAATLAVAALALTACGTTTVNRAGDESVAASSQSCADDKTATSTAAVSLTDGVGRQVKLEQPAKRIAVLEWQQIEDALTWQSQVVVATRGFMPLFAAIGSAGWLGYQG